MDDQNNEVRKTSLQHLNELFKKTAEYFTLNYKLLIYNLLKNGHVKIVDLSQDSGLSETRLYQIIDEVNKLKEKEGESL